MRKLLIIFLCVLTGHSYAQNIEVSIPLKDSTISKVISFGIKKGTREINFYITGYLSDGLLSFEITDPEGKKEGGFKLSAYNDEGERKPGSGRMTHNVIHPIPGEWEVKIETEKARGSFTYSVKIK